MLKALEIKGFLTFLLGLNPSGDGFIVYPTESKINYSIRAELIKEALQDYSALKTLERLTGKEFVMDILEIADINGYNEYPKCDESFLRLRKEIYEQIKKYVD